MPLNKLEVLNAIYYCHKKLGCSIGTNHQAFSEASVLTQNLITLSFPIFVFIVIIKTPVTFLSWPSCSVHDSASDGIFYQFEYLKS